MHPFTTSNDERLSLSYVPSDHNSHDKEHDQRSLRPAAVVGTGRPSRHGPKHFTSGDNGSPRHNGSPSSTCAVPKPGPTNDAPYAPLPILQGGVVITLYSPK